MKNAIIALLTIALGAVTYVENRVIQGLAARLDELHERDRHHQVDAQMREMGVCLWRDRVHQAHRRAMRNSAGTCGVGAGGSPTSWCSEWWMRGPASWCACSVMVQDRSRQASRSKPEESPAPRRYCASTFAVSRRLARGR